MSESNSNEGEDPFFSSIRALKAMIQPKSPSLSSRLDVVPPSRDPNPNDTTTTITTEASAIEKSNIQSIGTVLMDLQSKLKTAETNAAEEMERRLAMERVRDDVQSRLNASENAVLENNSYRKTMEQELINLRLVINAAEERVAEEKSIRRTIEQEMIELQSALTSSERKFVEETALRITTQQSLVELQSKVEGEVALRSDWEEQRRDLQNEIQWMQGELKEMEFVLTETRQELADTRGLLFEEEHLRLVVEQEVRDLQSTVKSISETTEQEKINYQSTINDVEVALNGERILRSAIELERDNVILTYNAAVERLESRTNRNSIHNDRPPVLATTPGAGNNSRNMDTQQHVVDELQSKLSAATATAVKERQQRLDVQQERDDAIVDCQEARMLFESPMKGDEYFLKKEAQRLLTSRTSDRKKHLKEMDHIHLQLQRAISQRDSMEARILGSKTITDDLSDQLEHAHLKIKALELKAANATIITHTAAHGKHCRSDTSDSTLPNINDVMRTVELLNDNDNQSHKCRKLSNVMQE